MLSPAELARMAAAVETILKHCINRRQALKPKEAEFLRPQIEALHQHLAAAVEKRDAHRE